MRKGFGFIKLIQSKPIILKELKDERNSIYTYTYTIHIYFNIYFIILKVLIGMLVY